MRGAEEEEGREEFVQMAVGRSKKVSSSRSKCKNTCFSCRVLRVDPDCDLVMIIVMVGYLIAVCERMTFSLS